MVAVNLGWLFEATKRFSSRLVIMLVLILGIIYYLYTENIDFNIWAFVSLYGFFAISYAIVKKSAFENKVEKDPDTNGTDYVREDIIGPDNKYLTSEIRGDK